MFACNIGCPIVTLKCFKSLLYCFLKSSKCTRTIRLSDSVKQRWSLNAFLINKLLLLFLLQFLGIFKRFCSLLILKTWFVILCWVSFCFFYMRRFCFFLFQLNTLIVLWCVCLVSKVRLSINLVNTHQIAILTWVTSRWDSYRLCWSMVLKAWLRLCLFFHFNETAFLNLHDSLLGLVFEFFWSYRVLEYCSRFLECRRLL